MVRLGSLEPLLSLLWRRCLLINRLSVLFFLLFYKCGGDCSSALCLFCLKIFFCCKHYYYINVVIFSFLLQRRFEFAFSYFPAQVRIFTFLTAQVRRFAAVCAEEAVAVLARSYLSIHLQCRFYIHIHVYYKKSMGPTLLHDGFLGRL